MKEVGLNNLENRSIYQVSGGQSERILFMYDGKIVSEMKLSKFNNSNLDERIEKITDKMRQLGI